jgi:hypothetical protein
MSAHQLMMPRQDERDEDEGENESQNLVDDEEEELARMVLGDEPGFMAELGREAILGDDGDLEAGNELNQREEEDYTLEGVDDADVGSLRKFIVTEADGSQSSFFWIPGLLQPRGAPWSAIQVQTMKCLRQETSLYGKIAMTID